MTHPIEATIKPLLNPHAYGHAVDGPVQVIETHISWVLLAGSWAYKLKKPISTPFLDYSTLEKRHAACMEEVRLGQKYSPDLYVAVVPVTRDQFGVHMDGEGLPIDFAVQMKRFSANALLSHHLEAGQTTALDMVELGKSLAQMHAGAETVPAERRDLVESIGQQAFDNFQFFHGIDPSELSEGIGLLEAWTRRNWQILRERFVYRLTHGWMRQCHGDLHCENIIFWRDRWSAFDGIEFNEQLSNIDVISDIAFLVMDLQMRQQTDFAAILLNAYLEATGDYHGLQLLQWYLVYRALVRAKVACIRASQMESEFARTTEQEHVRAYLALALNYVQPRPIRLWITHGVSGSGKTIGSDWVIAQRQMIRIRSDVQRRRLFSKPVAGKLNQLGDGYLDSGSDEIATGIYSTSASEATYLHLWSLARELLMAGYSVLVDATFLRQRDRQRFHELARAFKAEFCILHFDADRAILERRICERLATGLDASEASIRVLEFQLANQEPLTPSERTFVLHGSRSNLAAMEK